MILICSQEILRQLGLNLVDRLFKV